ncbi:MAG: DNA-processing protein DprA [Gemmatimonadota bacterium]|nr:DNA-processing protein DprA [Gemmatimonadota bacterium]
MSRAGNSPTSPDARAALALSMVEGVGCATFRQLMERFGSAARVFDDAAWAGHRDRAFADADAALADGARTGMILLPWDDPRLPPGLADCDERAPVLWALGDLTLLDDRPRVAIVGTRRATAYGLRVTRALAGAFARAGACVVSGLARGIDSAAHRAALEAGGSTIAVLGTGADVAYPPANRALHAELASGNHGLVLSEYPPGEWANGGSFPRRNRIIAALAPLTVIVEAGVKSGALLTARWANTLNRSVGVVPGCIDQPQSEGTNALIRDGAHIVTSVEDALALAGLTRPPRFPEPEAGSDEGAVWGALAHGGLDLDELCARSALPADRCLAAVTALELRGAVECSLAGAVRRRIG